MRLDRLVGKAFSATRKLTSEKQRLEPLFPGVAPCVTTSKGLGYKLFLPIGPV